jgi:hypothetical protein
MKIKGDKKWKNLIESINNVWKNKKNIIACHESFKWKHVPKQKEKQARN